MVQRQSERMSRSSVKMPALATYRPAWASLFENPLKRKMFELTQHRVLRRYLDIFWRSTSLRKISVNFVYSRIRSLNWEFSPRMLPKNHKTDSIMA
jgi:hypothetical protein